MRRVADPALPPITRLSSLASRSISAENPDGAVGGGGRATTGTGARAARDLGPGWKMSPSVVVPAGSTVTLADIAGPGLLQHLWMAVPPEWYRRLVLRIHWDGSEVASVDVPVGDLFCLGWSRFDQVTSQHVVAAPHSGLNAYWPMPFAEHARMTLENVWHEDLVLYFTLDYAVGDLGQEVAYFHGCWRRSAPVVGGLHEIASVSGRGHYVGTYLAFDAMSPGWWGEGEVQFFLDDDDRFPTVCGTGTEDYFGGAWDFNVPGRGYTPYSAPYLGLPQVLRPDGLYESQQRFGMYRWHDPDPIRFTSRLRVTVQDLGWRPDGRYRLRADDLATSAYWYAAEPGPTGSTAPTLDAMETSSWPPPATG